MRVEVVRTEGDLKRRVWTFSIWALPQVHLDWYSEETRATKRHKFRSVRSYSRLNTNSFRLRVEPPVPEEVVADMRQQVLGLITFAGETSA